MNEFTWKQMAQTNGTQNQVLMVNIIISVYNKHEQITVVQIIMGCASASTTRTMPKIRSSLLIYDQQL